MAKKAEEGTLDREKITHYMHYLVLPMKIAGCWDWFPKPDKEFHIIINDVYLALVLFVLTNVIVVLLVNLYTEWVNVMLSLDRIADGLPVLASVAIVIHFALHKKQLYEVVDYMNKHFKFRSARGLTNMNMFASYKAGKNFGLIYTASSLFSVTMYVTAPVVVHFWTKEPLDLWVYMDINRTPFYIIAFLKQALGQLFIGLAMGQLTVFFAANCVLLCGQLDLLCCSLRNSRYTALLNRGVTHAALAAAHGDIGDDERHQYAYTDAEMVESKYHFDELTTDHFTDRRTQFDIYSSEFDTATIAALIDCARIGQSLAVFKDKFERFVSPILVVRVVQVTLMLCTLLYAATLEFDISIVEYLAAAAFDMFLYCYYGNQIILQADRVSTAAYQSAWPAAGARARRLLLNLLLAHKRAAVVRAGGFVPIDLRTYQAIIKTSFSYYTLLVNVNEKKPH